MKRGTVIALALVGVLAVLAIVGPALAPDPNLQPDPLGGALQLPSAAHWLGTDQLSRDVLARLAAGARASLLIAALAVSVATVVGTMIGLAAASRRVIAARTADQLINFGLATPRVIVVLVVLAAVGGLRFSLLAIVLGLTGWPAIARLVRGEALRLRETPYALAAEALGAAPARVLWREIFPGTVAATMIAASLAVADVILLEAGLSFIGVGIRLPAPSWGGMIFEARDHLVDAPWLLIAPCAALVIATSAATLLGESLRRSLHPESR